MSPPSEEGRRTIIGVADDMGDITDLLEDVCAEMRLLIGPHLSETQRALTREFLPQVWVFETEDQTASIVADRGGNVFVQAMGRRDRDITVQCTGDRMTAFLGSRNVGIPSRDEPPIVLVHTEKGRAAFQFFRNRLSLNDRSVSLVDATPRA